MGQHFDRMLMLTRGAFGRGGFFAENWMPVEQDPAFKPLLKKHRLRLPRIYAEKIDRLPEDERERGRIEAAMDAARTDTQQLRSIALIDLMGVVMGVACAADRIEEAIPRLQETADRMFGKDIGPWPEFGKHVHDIPAVHVAVEFANLLKWTRDILERLERPDGGLLSAMAPRLYARAVPLQEAFEKIAERLLANYTLHGGLVVQPFEGAQLMQDGRVIMRVPDRPDARVPSRFHLEYQQGRDVLTVAREIVKATEALVKGLCAAFEAEDQAIEADRRAAGLWPGP